MGEVTNSLSQNFAKHRSLCRRDRYCPMDAIFNSFPLIFSLRQILIMHPCQWSRVSTLKPHPVTLLQDESKVIHFDPNMKRHGSIFREYPIPAPPAQDHWQMEIVSATYNNP
jgi:hypothetical protein